MLNISNHKVHEKIALSDYASGRLMQEKVYFSLFNTFLKIFFGMVFIVLFLPWTQNVSANGNVTTLLPSSRPQTIQSPIPGRIEAWYVQEGDFVNKGDTLVRISEIKSDYFDVDLLDRTQEQITATIDAGTAYKRKAVSLQRQISALKQEKKLKLTQGENKLIQSKLKVKSDGKNVNDDHRPESIFGKFLYGVSMRASTDQRLRYNANNPFPVYGGLLEEEHVILNKCKSMNSKVHLVIYWLNEFIARASKTDMLGGIGQPIISRVFQELSDANLAYERARRIAVIQFPFVLQQMSEIFVLFLVPLVPILNLSKVGDPILSAVLTFFSVLCFLGLYEAARDVEDPYMYEPNDLPMVEICHEFCMALVAMTVHPRAPGGKSDSSTKPAVSGNIVMW